MCGKPWTCSLSKFSNVSTYCYYLCWSKECEVWAVGGAGTGEAKRGPEGHRVL